MSSSSYSPRGRPGSWRSFGRIVWALGYLLALAAPPVACWSLGWLGDEPAAAVAETTPTKAAPDPTDVRTEAVARFLEKGQGRQLLEAPAAPVLTHIEMAGVETDDQHAEAERAANDFHDSLDRQLAGQSDSEGRERYLAQAIDSEENLYLKHQLLARLRQELASREPAPTESAPAPSATP
jgi:hypothetical protein